MEKKKLEEWITKREIKRQYIQPKNISKKFKKSFSVVLKSLDKSIKEAEILLNKLD